MKLSEAFDGAVREGLKSRLHRKALEEKEKQQAHTPPQDASGGGQWGLDSLFGEDEPEGGSGAQDGGQEQTDQPSSKTGADDQEKLADANIEPKDVVEKLNSIRSGKSFKDSAVKGAIEEYIESLSPAEKTALFAYVAAIAKIVTGVVPAQQADKPEEHPSDVHMRKGHDIDRKTKSIKPNVVRVNQAAKGSGKEDTLAPLPVTPKRK